MTNEIQLLAAGACAVVFTGLLAISDVASAGSVPAGHRTSAVEATRVDRVPTPHLDWTPCREIAECAAVRLPLDYDEQDGPTTEIALLRVKARDQSRRIGSLFVNPGGPGASARAYALRGARALGDEVVDRFDLVGFNPRGVDGSDNMRCFPDERPDRDLRQG